MSAKFSLLRKLALSSPSLALFLFGCEEDMHYHDDYDSEMTDSEALEELFLEDLDLEDPDVWQDGSDNINADELRALKALDEPIEPLAGGESDIVPEPAWRSASATRTMPRLLASAGLTAISAS